ncbi:MAG: hypothetical protein COA33_006315 [Fluviicola sp.]|nr:hypothetical protein [Fluviicola sp.]
MAIIDKDYFSCYRNPFHQFWIDTNEFVWLSGLYDGEKIVKDLIVFINDSDTTNFICLNFEKNENLVFSLLFDKISNIENGYKLNVHTDYSLEYEDKWNCSRYLGHYSILFNESVEIYYLEDLILTFTSYK